MVRLPLLGLATLAISCSLFGCDDIGSDESNATEVVPETTHEAQALRALLNDPATTKEILTAGKVSSAAAKSLIAHRNGADGQPRTADDNLFDTVAEVDSVKNVGAATLKTLVKVADQRGYLAAQKAKVRSVIFSPQSADKTHNVEVAKRIAGAQKSIDIAMYSYSDAGIGTALSDAVKRGVKVRFIFETAGEDKKLTGPALQTSKSGKLEAAGVDVRYVNKIMHHKFMIVDGPRDEAAAANTATVVSGSGNWSSGAGTKYDENTMFMLGYPELALRLQRDFNLLWEHSNDFVGNPALTFEKSSLAITDDLIVEDPGMHVFFTSDNFTVTDAVFKVTAANRISDELVKAIEGAEDRIHVASGHLRSRPVAEALMKKAADDPGVEITVYLDGQEYISESGNTEQKAAQQTCLAAATTDAKKRACLDKSFLYGLEVERAGINVRYKYYAYRWDASYADQMHNKVLIIDDSLYTGSYNLSDNAEHNTFENMFLFKGPEFRDLVATYEDKFQSLMLQGEGLLPGLRKQIDEEASFPMVFTPMSLSWTEVRDLKSLILRECPQANSADFRANPGAHKFCTK